MITSITDFNLHSYNTFRINAKCRELIEYTSSDDLPSVMRMVGDRPFVNIGAGSNMLFTENFDGVVLHSRILDISSVAVGKDIMLLRVGAGVVFDDLIQQCAGSGLWGIENLSGIPGEAGAAAVQNVGAYGVEVCDVLQKIECYDVESGSYVTFSKDDCGYGYRHSMFKTPENHNRYIVTHIVIELSSVPAPRITYGSLHASIGDSRITSPQTIRDAVIAVRNAKLPSVDEFGSAGSFFKNPVVERDFYIRLCRRMQVENGKEVIVPHYDLGTHVKIPAAWLIEQCGLKGYAVGNVAVWHLQPLVIINKTGKATADEILALEQLIIEKVSERFGIILSPEVEHIVSPRHIYNLQ